MMSKNASTRIKIAQIKSHPWFALYKISFQESPPETTQRKSNLLTDSMVMEGEDPFDDFMNKRLNYSNSSGNKTSEESSIIETSDFGNLSDIDYNHARRSASFKKQEGYGDLSFDTKLESSGLEIIPEERGVIASNTVFRFQRYEISRQEIKEKGDTGR